MNTEQIDSLGQWAANRIQHILQEKEDLENLINVFGKPILEDKKTEQPTQQEIDSLTSTEKTSNKGTYFLITKAENSNNSAFDKLQSYITQHDGFVNLHGKKLWTFSNDPTNKIGYK